MSKAVFKDTGHLIPVGSSICRRCREKFYQPSTEAQVHDAAAAESALCRLSKQICQIRLQDQDESMTSCDQETSMYHAPDTENDDGSEEEKFGNPRMSLKNKQDALNQFLTECGKEPVMTLRLSLKCASDKTVQRHVQQASEVISSVLTVLAPDDAGELWSRIVDAKLVEPNLRSTVESSFVKAFVETYKNATHAATNRQVLSMMADIMSLEQLRIAHPRPESLPIH